MKFIHVHPWQIINKLISVAGETCLANAKFCLFGRHLGESNRYIFYHSKYYLNQSYPMDHAIQGPIPLGHIKGSLWQKLREKSKFLGQYLCQQKLTTAHRIIFDVGW